MVIGMMMFVVFICVVVVIGSFKVVSEGGVIVEVCVCMWMCVGMFWSWYVWSCAYETSGYSKVERGGESSELSELSELCVMY